MNADGSGTRQLMDLAQDQDFSHNEYLQTKGIFWSPDGTRILCFAIREGSIDLHLVHVADGRSERLSAADGQHLPVGWIDDRRFAFSFESHNTPPDLYVQAVGEPPDRIVTHARRAVYRKDHFERMKRVDLKAADGLPLAGYLHEPSWAEPDQKLPALVFCHTYCPGQNYDEWNPIFSYLVESGYVLLRLDHRGSSGYGRAFLEAAVGEHGRKVPEDVAQGARFLMKHPQVDPGRIGVVGYSYGGSLVNFALAKYPDMFRAGVSVFGTVDRRGQRRRSWAYYMGGPEEEVPQAYVEASPITYVDQIRGPVLLLGGKEDVIVDTTQTYRYVEALRRAGKYYELVMYPRERHGLRVRDHQLDSYRHTMRFLNRFLQ